jgi:aldose 1-epimerase
MGNPAPNVAKDIFGALPDGRAVERVVLRGAGGFEAHIITYGAALQALVVPDARGICDDVVLGYDDLASYLGERRFFGATVRPLCQSHRQCPLHARRRGGAARCQ